MGQTGTLDNVRVMSVKLLIADSRRTLSPCIPQIDTDASAFNITKLVQLIPKRLQQPRL